MPVLGPKKVCTLLQKIEVDYYWMNASSKTVVVVGDPYNPTIKEYQYLLSTLDRIVSKR